jgi:glyoxylase-like metal-dependent hydrolase (beta-lactamase superfamily II)
MTGGGNWTYFLAGRAPVLIDAGVGADAHLDEIARHHAAGPVHVVVTHGHVDHVSGVEALARRWPATRFSKLPWPDRDRRYPVAWQPLQDGAQIAAGDETLEVIHTPGHAPDHVVLWHAPSRTLISGDLVVVGTTVVIPATNGGSLSQYLQSLRRILALKPARLLPAHGPAIDDPERIVRRYLDHRHERERQVLSALEAGTRTVDALVARIYPGLSAPLVPMAKESVLAHLIKLEDDGFAARAGDEWHTRG